jgi:hypothetical protein
MIVWMLAHGGLASGDIRECFVSPPGAAAVMKRSNCGGVHGYMDMKHVREIEKRDRERRGEGTEGYKEWKTQTKRDKERKVERRREKRERERERERGGGGAGGGREDVGVLI